MNLQEHFLTQALKEESLENKTIKVDHLTSKVYVDGIERCLTFPKSILDYCLSQWSERTQDYYFKGRVSKVRGWLRKYPNIYRSNRGRLVTKKFDLDLEYYQELGRTKFGLSPTNECPWSYRFFESIMCGAIPVLGDKDFDFNTELGFKFYRHSDVKIYKSEWAEHNLRLLIKNCIIKPKKYNGKFNKNTTRFSEAVS